MLLRRAFFPPSVEDLRLVLSPILTPIVWALAMIGVPVDIAAIALHRRLWRRAASDTPSRES